MLKTFLLAALAVCWLAAPAYPGGMGDSLFIELSDTLRMDKAAERGVEPPATRRMRYVEVDPEWLERLQVPLERAQPDKSYGVELNLFDDASFWVVFDEVYTNRSGSVSWIGHLDDIEMSSVVFVVRGDVLVGNIKTLWASYAVRSAGDGLSVVAEINESALPPELDPIPVEEEEPGDAREADSPMEGDSGAVIDLLVVYTGAAKSAAGGTPDMESLIELAVNETNLGYQQSGIAQRLNLVHTAEVTYSESGFDWGTTLSRLTSPSDGYMDEVHGLRDAYGADEVVLIVNDAGYCGISWLMAYVSPGFESHAFAMVSLTCATGYYSFGHELGHNMGARHDWYDDATVNSPYSYNHGYVDVAAHWRTIMAYPNQCGGCPRLNYWSNPDVIKDGDPMGVPIGTSTSCTTGQPGQYTCDADNRTTLNNTAFTVANFRQSTTVGYTLSVAKTGSGSGTVTSSPAGISCGTDCSEAYAGGQVVTLTAAESAGSIFEGWSGGGCSGTGDCVVTMDDHTTVTATFKGLYTLTVAKTGSGSGTVTSSPAGIGCGADCSEAYTTGQVVTLTAAESAGSIFEGWSGGGCSGTGDCVVTMSSSKTVTATFGIVASEVIYVPSVDFDTIQSALANAADGDVVKVAQKASPYEEDLILNESKTLFVQATDPTFTNPSTVRIAGMLVIARGTVVLDKGLFTIE